MLSASSFSQHGPKSAERVIRSIESALAILVFNIPEGPGPMIRVRSPTASLPRLLCGDFSELAELLARIAQCMLYKQL